MTDTTESTRHFANILVILLPIFSFAIPFLVLYFDSQTSILYYSFELTWKGRTFYVFFLWLALLEIILAWDSLQSTRTKGFRSVRTVAFVCALLLPTIYLIASNYYSFPSKEIVDWSWRMGIDQPDWIPLDVEYFVLAALFALIVWLQHGIKGIKSIAISPVFLATIGAIYTIDNIYRYGEFTPFQILVPTTATLAARLLDFLGYHTQLILGGSMPILRAYAANSPNGFAAAIAWPCSGVESLLIYTVTIALFLKRLNLSLVEKIAYFVAGAVVTYFINVLRIATIFIIAVNAGTYVGPAQQFHDLYGQLYSIIWILSYPAIIVGLQAVSRAYRNRRRGEANRLALKTVPEIPQ
jgi:thaumarchaeosortase